jgi:hypothetical protein
MEDLKMWRRADLTLADAQPAIPFPVEAKPLFSKQ